MRSRFSPSGADSCLPSPSWECSGMYFCGPENNSVGYCMEYLIGKAWSVFQRCKHNSTCLILDWSQNRPHESIKQSFFSGRAHPCVCWVPWEQPLSCPSFLEATPQPPKCPAQPLLPFCAWLMTSDSKRKLSARGELLPWQPQEDFPIPS